MRAIVRNEYGSAEVLRLVDLDVPEPGPREVRVRVEAAGVDIGVWHLMTGLPTMARLALGLRAPRSAGMGTELAGVVDAVGTEVTRFGPGDRVFGTGSGTFAEYALAPEKNLVARPEGVTAEAAAASAISGVTAWQALAALSEPYDRVLVIGASGGVGSFVVQFAKAAGAHVTGVASAQKLDFVRSLGADEVLDYRTADATEGSQTYDAIVEMGGLHSLADLRRALAPRGRAVIVGGEGGGRVTGGFLGSMTAGIRSLPHRQKASGLMSLTKVDDLTAVGAHLASGAAVPAFDRVFPLAETSDAVRRLEARQVRGKLVIDPTR
jgi:NADPH:quinone reductase-like Zn-dependent oxidoreductase